MSKLFDCRCRCADPRLLYVPVVTDLYALDTYEFSPVCNVAYNPVRLVTEDKEPTWTGGGPTVFCPGAGTITATMTASGLAPGDVVIEFTKSGPVTLARYENAVAWQPNCDTQMRLTEWDETCGVLWDQHPCLKPAFDLCGGTQCLCDDSEVQMRVIWTIPDPEIFNPGGDTTDYEAVAEFLNEGPLVLPCVDSPPANFCVWAKRFEVDGKDYSVEVLYNRHTHRIHTTVLDILLDDVVIESPSLAIPEDEEWCSESPWMQDGFNLVYHVTDPLGSVVYQPVQVENSTRLNADLECGSDDFSNCGGTSLWLLSAYSISPGVKRYYWVETENTCDGSCVGYTCESSVPFALPTGDVTDENAEDYEILDRIGEEIEGDCGCVPPYEPPIEPDPCGGYSTWKLQRISCGELWLYYWLFVSTHCGGACGADENCEPQPPVNPEISLSPVASNETLNAELDVENESGTCACDDPYVPPDCPECDCTDETDDKTFTLSGFGGGEAIYNGSYTLVKDAFDCAFIECCWYGSDNDFEINAIISWDSGLWTLSIDGGVAVYELAEDACAETLVLNKTIGGASWPSTLTVS